MERGEVLVITDQIAWQCPTCHILLGGAQNSCTSPDCKGSKETALRELRNSLGLLFRAPDVEEGDSPNVISLAVYVDILLDSRDRTRSDLTRPDLADSVSRLRLRLRLLAVGIES